MTKKNIKDKNIKIMNKRKTIKRMRGGMKKSRWRLPRWPQRWSKKNQSSQKQVITSPELKKNYTSYYTHSGLRLNGFTGATWPQVKQTSPNTQKFSFSQNPMQTDRRITYRRIWNPFPDSSSNENSENFIAEIEKPKPKYSYNHENDSAFAPPAPIVEDPKELLEKILENKAVRAMGAPPNSPDNRVKTELNKMFSEVEETPEPNFYRRKQNGTRKNHNKIKPLSLLPLLKLSPQQVSTATGGSRTLKKKKSKTRKNKNKNNTRNKKK